MEDATACFDRRELVDRTADGWEANDYSPRIGFL